MLRFCYHFIFLFSIIFVSAEELQQSFFKARTMTIPDDGGAWWDSFAKTNKQMRPGDAGLVDCCLWCSMTEGCSVVTFNEEDGWCDNWKELTSR